MTTESSPDARIMEAYKLAVEMADRVSARRAVANAFFLTVNTTLVSVVGLRAEKDDSILLSIAVCAAGFVVAACWWLLLQNYRRLNKAKFTIINKIEDEHLPVKVFKDEWDELNGDPSISGRTKQNQAWLRQLGSVERIIPFVFAALYSVLFIGRLV